VIETEDWQNNKRNKRKETNIDNQTETEEISIKKISWLFCELPLYLVKLKKKIEIQKTDSNRQKEKKDKDNKLTLLWTPVVSRQNRQKEENQQTDIDRQIKKKNKDNKLTLLWTPIGPLTSSEVIGTPSSSKSFWKVKTGAKTPESTTVPEILLILLLVWL